MSAAEVLLVEKACRVCGVVKPLADYHRNRARPDGHRTECKDCANAYALAYLAEERAKDPEGLRRRTRQSTDRHRRRTGNARGKALDAARRRATQELIEAHREEFERRYRIAKHEAGLI